MTFLVNDEQTFTAVPLNDLNTIAESAKWLRISESQLRTLRREGTVPPPTTMLGKPLYTREQLLAIKAKAEVLAGWHA